jgi:hypothetical protein
VHGLLSGEDSGQAEVVLPGRPRLENPPRERERQREKIGRRQKPDVDERQVLSRVVVFAQCIAVNGRSSSFILLLLPRPKAQGVRQGSGQRGGNKKQEVLSEEKRGFTKSIIQRNTLAGAPSSFGGLERSIGGTSPPRVT